MNAEVQESLVCKKHGDMLGNNDSTSRDTAKHKNNLHAAAYDIRWMSEFGMTKAAFDELLVRV